MARNAEKLPVREDAVSSFERRQETDQHGEHRPGRGDQYEIPAAVSSTPDFAEAAFDAAISRRGRRIDQQTEEEAEDAGRGAETPNSSERKVISADPRRWGESHIVRPPRIQRAGRAEGFLAPKEASCRTERFSPLPRR